MLVNGLFSNLDSMNLLIYSATNSPRLSYILNFIFNDFFECNYELTTDLKQFSASDKVRINYSNKQIEGCFNITPHSLLFEEKIDFNGPKLHLVEELLALEQPISSHAHFSSDPFAFSFYCLSRYEEYLPFAPDQFNRFTARQSMLFQFGFLDIPVVDNWLLKLRKELEAHSPGLQIQKKHTYKVFPTVDIDVPWYLKNRSKIASFQSLIKSLARFELKTLRKKWRIIKGEIRDPFDTYEYLRKRLIDFPSTIFFMLVGNKENIDTNFSVNTPSFHQLVSQIEGDFRLGLHPSSYANRHIEYLKEEYKYLTSLVNSSLVASRQHYIKLRFPNTYRRLLETGIKKDFSMGFPDASGFRAGTAHAFYWFDLEYNRASNLKIYPFFTMDVTLRQYEHLDQDQAIQRVLQLKTNIKEVGGIACFIWHNSSLSEIDQWSDWQQVLDTLLQD